MTDQEAAAALLDAVSGQDCPLTVLRKQGRDSRPDIIPLLQRGIFLFHLSVSILSETHAFIE